MALNADVSSADRRVVYLYPGPRIVVTNRWIENAQGRFLVRDLRPIIRAEVRAYPAWTMALIFGAIELLLAVPLAAVYGSAMLLCVGLASAVGLGIALLVDGWRNPRWMALVAVYRGQEITLFSTRDQQEFGKVRRAVIRAVEANGTPRL
ncbi:hypothetical protein Daura_01580 [Dactylosporangium aurantiacum]|uniref:Uncharacterized protein n=1 Tax=Dactylosporangium aurantiacum TaxID=35754 RepID=A0A9Q9IFY9_9ACTN|nr:DUF6232 family protein [Dactylosporangium aurantiacum]MDG6100942.1 DUF6232 family protein [Dactylosporangium aurantiacum]UWZ55006.1 hypothetical protein Daura_01580 [Dactylosporangium aurantiacum]